MDWYVMNDELHARQADSARRQDAFNAARGEDAERALRDLLGAVGSNVEVRAPLYVDYGDNIYLGDGVYVNFGLTALDVADIRIGDGTLIGPNVSLLTPVHPMDPQERATGIESARPITIGANVWIGGGAMILPGVTVGDDAVIGAGAVVTKDVEAATVVAGNPARPIRTLRPRT